MGLASNARIAVVGAGPSGLVAAKNLLDVGLEPTVFEASDAIGGQWHSAAAHSGIWPGMRTNTSRAMTAFSDLPYAPDLPLHPSAEQIQAYLISYAATFALDRRVRLGTPVRRVERRQPGWLVDGEPFDALVVASGRFCRPVLPSGLGRFTGRLLHAFDYPGAEHCSQGRTLVYGNGVSGHEIAADIAARLDGPVDASSSVVSAYRKPRYVLQKNVDGVASDWQWYTHFGAIQRRAMPAADFGRMLRERVVRVAGNPADFGAPRPDDDIGIAGHSLAQDYLPLVRDGRITCRPAVTEVDGRTVTFSDQTSVTVDTFVCATGYAVHLPYLSDDVKRVLGPQLALHHETIHPDLPTLGVIGQFALQGPYFPLLELQARWIAGLWAGTMPSPADAELRAAVRRPPAPVVAHHLLAVDLSEAAGVAPDLAARPDLAEPLLFGPMLPPRYRLDGPGAQPGAAEEFRRQVTASPRAPVEPDDVAALPSLGLDRYFRTHA